MTADSTSPRLWVALCLALILLGALVLRAPGVDWLIGSGPQADYTFHPDDHRFINGARNFEENWPDGYVVGMTSQVFVVLGIAEQFGPVNGVRAMRMISQFYALLTLLLTYFTARTLGLGRVGGVTAAAFLAVAPMHVINASFGTADMPVVAFFYLSFLCACAFLRGGKEMPFILCMALTGGALALKFFLPAIALAGTMLLLSPERLSPSRYLSAFLLVIAGFFVFSLFNYTIWDFMPFMRSLLFDNVIVPGGHGPIMQAIKYGGDMVPAMGIAAFLCFALGSVLLIRRVLAFGAQAARRAPGASRFGWLLEPPAIYVIVLAAGLLVHAILLVIAGIHGPRHILVFLPAACVLVGYLTEALVRAPQWRLAGLAFVSLAFLYSAGNAYAAQRMYSTDLRSEMAAWARPIAAGGSRIVSMAQMQYARVAGSLPVQGEREARDADYFLTCDIEFRRYFRANSAEDIHHAYGQGRVEFFKALFAGKERFVVERVFNQKPTGIETALIEKRMLPPMGMFIPRTCVAFRRVENPPGFADDRLQDAIDPKKNSW